ncbi:type II toxin-antitoxin system RelE/ParE family toxin [Sulfuricurvum sp. IAE1]|jgi:plasmid stabilization system protein ParE|uniref:type II toxin-antitoxin system RelE/ParE family toxin n=1 Tax=Sulfuricurvum sp. IAE1 TaxID=2546102 RepID=UPI0010439A82|nr:type II toxin-antitoxin system RelE/ParE family toxin [Sulfuricurvum sp. IAE1]TDA67371.1 type II toxin-antitoxin system RelE/ParE family toxin [Sulfuricurvum sp. IAE1]
MYSIIVEPEALQDLFSIHTFIASKDSKTKADRFVRELENAISALSDMPLRCRKSYYADNEMTRDLIYKGYTIVFHVVRNNVHILTVFRQRAFEK